MATLKNVVEFALLTVGKPLDVASLTKLFDGAADTADIRAALSDLAADWQNRALQLTQTAGGYQFISRPEYAAYLAFLRPKKTQRLSKQLMEVLAIIAYRQPVSRGDIEQVRGVSVSSAQLAALEELDWIEEAGRRETPGRPTLYATTKTFLDDLSLASLSDLPDYKSFEESLSPAETVGEEETHERPQF